MKATEGEKRLTRKEEAKTAKLEMRKPKLKNGVKGSRKFRREMLALRAVLVMSRLVVLRLEIWREADLREDS